MSASFQSTKQVHAIPVETDSGVIRFDSNQVTPSLSTIWRALGQTERPIPAVHKAAAEAATSEASSLIHPVGVWSRYKFTSLADTTKLLDREVTIKKNNASSSCANRLSGNSGDVEYCGGIHPNKTLSSNILRIGSNSKSTIYVVCTIGNNLERRVQRHFKQGRNLHAYFLDHIGTLSIAILGRKIAGKLSSATNYLHWAPGDGDAHLSWQKIVFGLLPTHLIGVRLTKRYVMTPVKSLSYVVLDGTGSVERKCGTSCNLCAWQGACVNNNDLFDFI